MAANPKRKGMSTLPVYLPKVSAKRAKSTGDEEAGKGQASSIYVDGGFDPAVAESLAADLSKSSGLKVIVVGEMISSLPRGPQLILRHAVAEAARGIAGARVRIGEKARRMRIPMRGEVDQEESTLRANTTLQYNEKAEWPAASEYAYDGALVQEAFHGLLPESDGAPHIVATSRALATWDEGTNKWVSQTVVPGNPVVVGLAADGSRADAEAVAEGVREALKQ